MASVNAHYAQKAKAEHGDLRWCAHCHCFHHRGVCPCKNAREAAEKRIRDLEAKVAELRGLLADYVTKDEMQR